MEILELTPKGFSHIFASPYYLYGRTDFNILNKEKVNELLFLAFKEKKYCLGLILGRQGNVLKSPFSAPFGGFIFIKNKVRISYLDSAILELETYSKQKGIKEIDITLPPPLYNETFISKQINSFFRAGFTIKDVDLNYHFDLDNFDAGYIDNIWYNARKNLKIALKEDLMFYHCEAINEEKLAYEIIKLNRKTKGFPLKMTWEQIQQTIEIIKADFFLVYSKKNPIAAAMIFQVAPEIYQVIYWGDNPEYSKLKPMNFLSYKVFEYYKNKDKKIVDIGPSTENSIPNLGLGEFKESIGSKVTTKYLFTKKYNI